MINILEEEDNDLDDEDENNNPPHTDDDNDHVADADEAETNNKPAHHTDIPVEVRHAAAVAESEARATVHATHRVGVHGAVGQDVLVQEATAPLPHAQSVEG